MQSDEPIWSSVDSLSQEARDNPSGLEELVQDLGFKHHPAGLLQHHGLRRFVKPARSSIYDFFHIYLVNGLAQLEIHLFLKYSKISWPTLHNEMQHWHLPKALDSSPKSISNRKREESCKTQFKAGGSEVLGAYLVLPAFFVVYFTDGLMEDQLASFMALCAVLDVYFLAQQGVISGKFGRTHRHSHAPIQSCVS